MTTATPPADDPGPLPCVLSSRVDTGHVMPVTPQQFRLPTTTRGRLTPKWTLWTRKGTPHGRMVPAVPDDTTPAAAPLRFRRLRDRLAGRPADTTLCRDISDHLKPVLRHWIVLACQHDDKVAQRVALRLGVSPKPAGQTGHSFIDALREVDQDPDLLDVVDAILAVHRAADWFHSDLADIAANYGRLVVDLRDALEDAGSAFTLGDNARQLVERVDPTVTEAFRCATENAEPTAAELLRDAWNQAYGLHPDPTAAYRQAVRAIEEVACPLVLPESPKATLGTVRDHLRDGGHKWRFVLVDRAGADTVDPLVAMLDRLWTGQVSRHGGAENSREQTMAEAEASVHVAVMLVQLLARDALARREPE